MIPSVGDQPPRTLLIVGGNLALDVANTVDDPEGPAHFDHIATYDRLLAWSTQVDMVTPAQARRLRHVTPVRAGPAVTGRAQQLREAVRAVFTDVLEGGHLLTGSWSRLRPFVADAVAEAGLSGGKTGELRLRWPPGDDPAALLHPVAFAAWELLGSGELAQVKRCANCPWLYVDRSKNHSRRWCSMQDCGTAVKIERYVARRAAKRKPR